MMRRLSGRGNGLVAPAGPWEWGPKEIRALNQDQMTAENMEALRKAGGVAGLAKKLGVDPNTGLCPADETDRKAEDAKPFEQRQKVFGANSYPQPDAKSLFILYLESFNDPILIVLIVAAVVSFVVGYLEDPEKGWMEGVAILVAVQIVSCVTAINDYSKEAQFRKLNAVKESIDVKVLRDGKQDLVSTHDLNVGDVVRLEAGDKVPCDGVFIRGGDVETNEASLTGEPEDLKKGHAKDAFLLSGCQITAGYCDMLVIAIGNESRWGRIKAKLAVAQADTPLQEKLEHMAALIGYVGTGAAAATFAAMLVLWYATDLTVDKPGLTLGAHVLHAFLISITIIVVAIPEGLPLAVTISLAYSTMKMLKDNNLIRVLAACETMGNATNICSDKTGTLTENRMTVVAGWFGGTFYDQDAMPDAAALGETLAKNIVDGVSINSKAVVATTADGRPTVVGNKTEGALLMMANQAFGGDWDGRRAALEKRLKHIFMFNSKRKMMSALVEKEGGGFRLFVKGASEMILAKCEAKTVAGGSSSPMDDASREALGAHILSMANKALRTIGIAYRDFESADALNLEEPLELQGGLTLDAIVGIIDPLRADVKHAVAVCQSAGIMVRMVTGDNIHTAKAIARQCGILTEGGEALEGPTFRTMTPAALDAIMPRLQVLARSSPDDKHALVTRLNGAALPNNRADWEAQHPGCSWDERDKVLPGYREEWVASRAGHPGEVVGVTGDGTNDAPALKAADVGLSMGLSGTEVAKEASDIVIMDDRFSSIVKAVLWGRSVYDNIRKFLQFQLTVNVVALLITFIGAVSGFDPPLNAVMMLWVNLIMDTLGALALGTEPPLDSLLERRPYKRNAKLVNKVMWRNILAQSAYQMALLVVLLFHGADPAFQDALGFSRFENGNYCQVWNPCLKCADNSTVRQTAWTEPYMGPMDRDGDATSAIVGWCDLDANNTRVACSQWQDVAGAKQEKDLCTKSQYRHFSIMFNAFVFCQVFNEFNARSIGNDWNVFKGLSTNPMFLFVIALTCGFQVFVINEFGEFAKTESLTSHEWMVTIAMGAVSLPLGVLMRYLPPQTESQSQYAGYDINDLKKKTGGEKSSL